MPTGRQVVRVSRYVGFVMLALTLYVGSVGPVGWLDKNGHVPKSVYPTLNHVYAPLKWIDYTPLRLPLFHYVKWCRTLLSERPKADRDPVFRVDLPQIPGGYWTPGGQQPYQPAGSSCEKWPSGPRSCLW